jgi:hypothetical protein
LAKSVPESPLLAVFTLQGILYNPIGFNLGRYKEGVLNGYKPGSMFVEEADVSIASFQEVIPDSIARGQNIGG